MDAPAQVLVAAAIVIAIILVVVAWFGVPRLARRTGTGASRSRIRVMGIGGGGGNAVDAMVRSRTRGVDFVVCNTDAQALRRSIARRKLQIGAGITHGLGAGGDPAIGEQAARDDAARIEAALRGSDLVFVTAGLGGGTGSGAAPVVAGIARQLGALTVGVVTRPFAFEGTQRRQVAERAHAELLASVDTLITIPNDRVHEIVPADAALTDAFAVVDDVLRQGVEGIVEIITEPGLVNLDFADVRTVMADGGRAILGIGRASGDQRAAVAARAAIASTLLEDTIDGATRILLSVAGSSSLGLAEVTGAAEAVRASADADANVIFGAAFDPRLGDEVRVTVIATGFGRRRIATEGRAAVSDEPEIPQSLPEEPAGGEPAIAAAVPDGEGAAATTLSHTYEAAELDVPTFMRRRQTGRRHRS